MGLSSFQREKLLYYFNFFDADGDGTLRTDDLPILIEKILQYTGWKEDSREAIELTEVHDAFFEVLTEKSGSEEDHVTQDDWFAIWENLLPGCMGMHNFPVWLRLLPKSLFRMIDVNNDDILDKGELTRFYVEFVKLPQEEAEGVAVKAFNEMTDFGRYPLNLDGYEQVFANFLLGRTPHGPGRYIFGCFEHAEKGGILIAGPPPDDDADIRPAGPRRGSANAIRAPKK